MVVVAMLAITGRTLLEAQIAAPARSATPKIPAAPVDPASLPRLQFGDLVYEGAFRLPADEVNGDTFSFGGRPIAYNAEHNSLFVGSRSLRVAEVSIPDPAKDIPLESLPFAAFVQPFADPANGHLKEVGDGTSLAGLLVYEHRLIGSGVIYYDAINAQSLSHFTRPMLLTEDAVKGLGRVGASGQTGYVAGYMASVPAEWQGRLGGPAITGQCCLPIISRTSLGPSAFVFDPATLGAGKNTPAEPLVYYSMDHPTLGPWEGANATYGATTEVGGVALIGGTSTALFIGRNGSGTFCYGNGTANRGLVDTRGADGEKYCFDPVTADKGQHAYPYRYQMWAYDLNDLAEVRAGKHDPWKVQPYGVWPFDLPFPEAAAHIGGVAYDAARRRVFIAQMQADRDGYAFRPLIHVFRIP
jgi:hypothetical protein